MNYFELFELPVQFSVDKARLKKKFYELSRSHHPDYFAQQEGHLQEQALDKSAAINKAYKILGNQDATIKYVLELKGLLTENEKYNLPPLFLMEMMELNERLAEAQPDASERASLLQDVMQTEAGLYQPVKHLIEGYNDDTATVEDLEKIKDYYFKKKYLERLKQLLVEKS